MASLSDLLNNAPEHVPGDDEYLKDGEIYCEQCDTPRTEKYWRHHHRIMCDCQKEEQQRQWEADAPRREAEREAKEKAEHQARVYGLKVAAGLGKRYESVGFESTVGDPDFMAVRQCCLDYCRDKELFESGMGLYLFGAKGTGKTRLTACMANELMDRLHSVIFTSIGEISKRIRDSFETREESELEYMRKLASVEYLFIDDLGTEQVTRNGKDLWLQEKVYEVVNDRYLALKPVVYTSNYSLKELETRGVSDKTLDRIMEVSEFVRLDGDSHRREIFIGRQGTK